MNLRAKLEAVSRHFFIFQVQQIQDFCLFNQISFLLSVMISYLKGTCSRAGWVSVCVGYTQVIIVIYSG